MAQGLGKLKARSSKVKARRRSKLIPQGDHMSWGKVVLELSSPLCAVHIPALKIPSKTKGVNPKRAAARQLLKHWLNTWIMDMRIPYPHEGYQKIVLAVTHCSV